ncbi:MAG: hypothetical protein AAFR81_14525, partial [Chloroflexota bacterium]
RAWKIKTHSQYESPYKQNPFSKTTYNIYTGKVAELMALGFAIKGVLILGVVVINLLTRWLDTVGLFFLVLTIYILTSLLFETRAYYLHKSENR